MLLLINGQLFIAKKQQIVANQFLFIKSGLIEDFGDMDDLKSSLLEECRIIDCQNMLVSPGLIDVHVHFRDPGYKFKEDIVSGSASAIAGGFTTVVCQPNTNPTLDNLITIDYLKDQIERNSKINIKFYCAATKGSLGQEIVPIQSLLKAGAVGITDDGLPISNAKIMMDLFKYSALLGIPIAQHAEDLNITNGGCVHHSRFSEEFNLATINPASEYSVIARDIALLEEVPKAKYHVLHVSCAKSLKYIREAKDCGLNVTAEVTPHHFIAEDSLLYDNWSLAKMNPPLRSAKDVSAIINAMSDEVIDIIASDHAPHNNDSKEKSISCASFGIIGLETMLPLSLELYHRGLISLERILTMLTINPAKLIGETKRGEIEIGKIADLSIIDINIEWTIDKNQMNSKSKNTPFHGRKVKGRNMMTICDGEVIYSFSSKETCDDLLKISS